MKNIPYNPKLIDKARANRKNPTPAENKLWKEVLKDKNAAGAKFTRQKPLGEYIVDFYCAKHKLAVEVDGRSHADRQDYDELRTKSLNRLGIRVLRFTNEQVLENMPEVREILESVMGK